MKKLKAQKSIRRVVLLGVGVLLVVLFQNCGKPSDSGSGDLGSAGLSRGLVHYSSPAGTKAVIHGVTGELIEQRNYTPGVFEYRIAVIGDVVGENGPDGIEDYLVYNSRQAFVNPNRVVSQRKFVIRSGKDDEAKLEKVFPDYSVPSTLNFAPTVTVIDDINEDGISDIMTLSPRNRFEVPSTSNLTTTEIQIFSGRDLMPIKLINIADNTGSHEYSFEAQSHVFMSTKKDLIFSIRVNYQFQGFLFVDVPTSTSLVYDLSYNQNAVGSTLNFDFNEDGKADYAYVDYNSKKIVVESFVVGQDIPDIDYSSLTVPDQWRDLYPDLVDWDGDALPELVVTYSRNIGNSSLNEYMVRIYELRDYETPLATLKAEANQYIYFARHISDINGDRKKDFMLALRDRQDTQGFLAKIQVVEPTSGLELYSIIPPRENNSSYSNSMWNSFFLRYLNL